MRRLEDSVSAHISQQTFGFVSPNERYSVGVVTLGDPIGVLHLARFRLRGTATVTGLVHVELQAFSGSLGTTQIPTAVLATSISVDVSLITADEDGELIDFPFIGVERIPLSPTTEFMLTINGSGITASDLATRRGIAVDGLGRSTFTDSWVFTAADRLHNFELYSFLAGGSTDLVDLTEIVVN